MTTTYQRIAVGMVVAGLCAAAPAQRYDDEGKKARAWKKQVTRLTGEYARLLEGEQTGEVVRRLLAAWPTADGSANSAALAAAMDGFAAGPRRAKKPCPPAFDAVLDALTAEESVAARTALAEVILEIGFEERAEDLLARAARLLDTEDPFVAGIAEWAIGLRVAERNNCRHVPPPWTDKTKDPPAWFVTWRKLWNAGNLARWDHVRQAVRLDLHRSAAALADNAPAVAERARKLAAYAELGGHAGAGEALASLGAAVAAVKAAAKENDLLAARRAWLSLRGTAREVVLAAAARWVPRLAYVRRRSFQGQHNISGNSQHQGKVPPPSDILIQHGLDLPEPTSLLGDTLPIGSIRGADLFFDADRIVFSYAVQTPDVWEHWPGNHWRKGNSNYERPKGGGLPQKLYEIGIDPDTGERTSGPTKITGDEKYIDMEPTYLPDGSVVFASDRGHGSSECGGWEQNATTLNLFRVWPAEGRIKRLTWNKDYDRYPHALPNGQIGYLRWDYQERSIFPPHTLWTVRPDGTYNDALFKEHLRRPYSLRDAMPVPGTEKLLAIGTGHHHCPEGWLIEIAPGKGLNEPEALRAMAFGSTDVQGGMPNDLRPVAEGGVHDANHLRGGWYQTPFPLNDKALLVAHCEDNGRAKGESFGFAIYFQDAWGNKEIVARDPFVELAYPMAVTPRTKPPILPDTTRPEMEHATCYVSDVYADLPGIERGEVKYIRISHRTDWTFFKGPEGNFRWYPHYPGFGGTTVGWWTWCGTRVIGTVPVADDGSAYFKVPVYTPVYFQALDADLMELRRMRSHVEFQPGEARGCIGCHETRAVAIGPKPPAFAASGRRPDHPQPPPWGTRRMIDYEEMVHPILVRQCGRCHSRNDPEAGIEFSSRRDGYGLLQSYRSLFGLKWGDPMPGSKNLHKWFRELWPHYRPGVTEPMDHSDSRAWFRKVYAGRAPGQLVSVLNHQGSFFLSMPKAFGSHRSKLITTLTRHPRHRKVRRGLTADEWETLVTFVDAGAPYSGKMLMKYDRTGRDLPRVMQVEYVYPDPWEGMDEYSSAGRPIIPDDLVERARAADARVRAAGRAKQRGRDRDRGSGL